MHLLKELLEKVEDELAKDEYWTYDKGWSAYKVIARAGFAILKEAVQWSDPKYKQSCATPWWGSARYIQEKLDTIQRYLPAGDEE